MIKHIVMWTLKTPTDAASFKTQLVSCQNVVSGVAAFEVATKTVALAGSCDVVLYLKFNSAAVLAAHWMHPHRQAVAAVLDLLRQSCVDMDCEA